MSYYGVCGTAAKTITDDDGGCCCSSKVGQSARVEHTGGPPVRYAGKIGKLGAGRGRTNTELTRLIIFSGKRVKLLGRSLSGNARQTELQPQVRRGVLSAL